MEIGLDAYAMVSGLILGVVWLVRLEGKIHAAVNANVETQKDVDELRVKHEQLDSKVLEQLSEIKQSLARLEGSLGLVRTKGE